MFSASWANLPDVAADGELKVTPPKATPKILPRPIILKPAQVTFHKNDDAVVNYVRNRFKVTRLHDLQKQDLRKLNISSTDFLSLGELLTKEYFPPQQWLSDSDVSSGLSKQPGKPAFVAVLLNGTRRPDRQKFYGFAKELLADLATVYRSLRRDPPPTGLENIKVLQFRKFWIALHTVGCYWDDSLDPPGKETENQSEEVENVVSETNHITLDTTEMDVDAVESDEESIEESSVHRKLTYTGRRTSTGYQMDSIMSLNLAEAFLEPLMYAFGCHFDQVSQGVHDLYFLNSITTCVHTKLIFSKPKDTLLARQGVLEGPIAVLHAHASVDFGPGTRGDIHLFMRELKAVLLCAQQRSRENEQPYGPGRGEWWGLASRKWGNVRDNGAGGLPGEAIGEPLTDLDLFPEESAQPPVPIMTTTNNLTRTSDRTKELATTNHAKEGEQPNTTNDLSSKEINNPDMDRESMQPGSGEKRIMVAPLTGDELHSQLKQSTLAPYSNYSQSSEGRIISSTDSSSDSEVLSAADHGSEQSTKKKRSFEAFVSHDESSNTREDTTMINSDATISPEPEIVLPSQPNLHTNSDNSYKLMLENQRKMSENEQKARRMGIKMANQPARDLFPLKRKKLRRIGMHPLATHDEIYLISVLNHHISFVHLKVDHKLMNWLSPNPREHARVASLKKDTSTWWGIPLRRSRWYDLFDGQDRVEALRAAWAIFSKMMADKDSDLEAAMHERDEMYGTSSQC